MKTISSKLKITIFVVAIVVIILSVFIGNAITRNNRITTELTAIAESYGLKDIKIIIGSKMKDYDFYEVTVDCSNLESLSYSEMYSLDNSMQVDDAYISKYTSNGNTYEIFPYTKSIYKNGRKIHDDYLNSQSHKDAIKNDKNKTEYSTSKKYSFTPHKSPSKDNDDDPYNAKDYSNEEDFYYDHYDDFFDYYDAEDYYNEHND